MKPMLSGFFPVLAASTLLFGTSLLQAQPVITHQPQNQSVPVGYDVTLRVRAEGTAPLAYQWRFGGAAIAGATNSSLRLGNAQLTNAGVYSVLVTNEMGATLSAEARLSVTPFGSRLKVLTISNMVDMVCDTARNRVYVSSGDSLVRYDMTSDTFLPPLQLGGTLWGLDISPDGNTLAIADKEQTETNLWIYLVDLTTGQSPQVSFGKAFMLDAGSSVVAFGKDGAVYVTCPSDNGAPNSLYRHDLASGVNTSLGIGTYELLAPSGDRSVMAVGQTHGSPSSFYTLDVASQKLTYHSGTPSYFCEFIGANRNGSQFAILTYGGTYLFNGSGNLINSFGGPLGLVYHPTSDLVFCGWSGTREMRALDTGTLGLVARYDLGYLFANLYQLGRSFEPGRMRVSNDGSVVLVKTDTGVNFLRWTNAAPTIATHPANLTGFVSNSVSFAVEAIGNGPFRYQWRFNGEALEDATNATLTLSSPYYTAVGTYSVAVLNPFGFVVSSNATLTLNGSPYIQAQPQPQVVAAGEPASFSVGVLGSAPLAYQWRQDGTNVASATTSSLTFISAQFTNQGDYTVVITNSYGATTSAVAVLLVNSPPFFTAQPASVVADQGTNVRFNPGVLGTPPMSFQWHWNGAALAGATDSSLELINVPHSAAGSYALTVSNAFGTAASSNALLVVNWPPEISQGPASQTAPAGTNVSFSVVAAGLPLNYLWKFNGSALSGATATSLSLTNLQAANAGVYTVVVSNHLGWVESAPAQLDVTPVAPVIVSQPQSLTNPAGSSASFSVQASGTEPFSYQWQLAGLPLAGQTRSLLMLTNIQAADAGIYTVLVTNTVGATLSEPADLTVLPVPPTLVAQPQGANATVGAELLLQVRAVGSEPMTYQWRRDDLEVPGANAASLVFSNLQPADAGAYVAVVTNENGAVTSATARVTVQAPPGFLWARGGGGTNNEEGRAVAVDAAGNVFVAGSFSGTAVFGASNLVSDGVVGADLFLARYDAAGNLVWIRQGGGAYDDRVTDVAVDAGGNLFIAGYFSGNLSLDGVHLQARGGQDIFVARYTTEGELLWATNAGGTSSFAQALGLAVDNATNVYLTGFFQGTATFGAQNVTASMGSDMFVARFDSTGNGVWARRAGGTGSDQGRSLACDSSGNVYVTGDFSGSTASFGSITLTNGGPGSTDIFVAKYDPLGNVLWATRGGGRYNETSRAIRVDSAGNAYVAGDYSGPADFGGITLATRGSSDLFLAKYSSAGAVQWARAATNSTADNNGLALDQAGNVFLAGKFYYAESFGGTNQVRGADDEAFVAMYTPAGDVLWARSAGGPGADTANAVAADRQGHVYVTGSFNAAAGFGHETLASAGRSDFFLAKMAAFDPSQAPVLTINLSNQTLVAGAGLTLGSGYLSPEPTWFQWRFNGEVLAGGTEATLVLSNVTASTAGAYTLVLSNLNGAITSAVANVTVRVEPDFVWTRRGGGTLDDAATATVVDASGNVYVAGFFSGTVEIGGRNLVSSGGEDWFVAKYDSLGTLRWVNQYGGPGDERATALAVVPGGGVAVAGQFAAAFSLGGTTLSNAGGWDVFLARLDANGGVQWAVRGGGPYTDLALAVAVDSSASGFYVTGSFQTNATFGGVVFSDTSSSNKLYLAKYNSNGTFAWATKTTGYGPSQGRALAGDGSGSVLVGGSFGGLAIFGSPSVTSGGALDGFVARYSSSGAINWVRKYGTASFTLPYDDRVNALAVDGAGNLWAAGDFQGEVSIAGTYTNRLSADQRSLLLMKLDASGAVQWARTPGVAGTSSAAGVAVDGAGNGYVTGSYSNDLALGDVSLGSAGGQEMFVALYDSLGSLVKARRAGGQGDEFGQAIATDGRGNVFVAGSHSATAAFGTNTVATAGGRDLCLTRLNFFAANVPPQITSQPANQLVVPGDMGSFAVGSLSASPVSYRWLLQGVPILGATTNPCAISNVQYAQLGNYSVAVQNAYGAVTSAPAALKLELTPEFAWLRQNGGTGDDAALAVALGGDQSVYVAGYFSATNLALNLGSSGGTDAYLAKYDASGRLIWSVGAGGTASDIAQALAVDGAGNVLLGGYFTSGQATFGSITLTNTVVGSRKLFLAKYDANGAVQWARSTTGFATSSPEQIAALAVDPSGNVYITGGTGAAYPPDGTTSNYFLAKYDEAGNPLWFRNSSGTNSSFGAGLCVDAGTNVLVTGHFFGTLNLGSGPLANTNGYFNASVFVARYDASGALRWVRKGPGGGVGFGQAIVSDGTGNLYASSYKRDYGSGILLTKYDRAGGVQWYHTAGISCCTGDAVTAAGLALDPLGNPVITGTGNGFIEGVSAAFGPGYVFKYRSDGLGFWMQRCGSVGNAVAVDPQGNLFVAGSLYGTRYFGATNFLVSLGGNDSFLARVAVLPPAVTASQTHLLVVAGSNTTLVASVPAGTGPFAYQWQLNGTNLAGATGSSLTLNSFKPNLAGRYSVNVRNPAGSMTGMVASIGLVPVLSVAAQADGLVLDWPPGFVLQSASNAAGPYIDWFEAIAPFTNSTAPTDPPRFFRLRVGDPTVTGTLLSNGAFNVGVRGAPGHLYGVEASADLQNWQPLGSEAAPFELPDTNTVGFLQRFYRAWLLP